MLGVVLLPAVVEVEPEPVVLVLDPAEAPPLADPPPAEPAP